MCLTDEETEAQEVERLAQSPQLCPLKTSPPAPAGAAEGGREFTVILGSDGEAPGVPGFGKCRGPLFP